MKNRVGDKKEERIVKDYYKSSLGLFTTESKIPAEQSAEEKLSAQLSQALEKMREKEEKGALTLSSFKKSVSAEEQPHIINFLSFVAEKENIEKETIANIVFGKRLSAFKKDLEKKKTINEVLEALDLWKRGAAGFTSKMADDEKKLLKKNQNIVERQNKMIRFAFDRILEIFQDELQKKEEIQDILTVADHFFLDGRLMQEQLSLKESKEEMEPREREIDVIKMLLDIDYLDETSWIDDKNDTSAEPPHVRERRHKIAQLVFDRVLELPEKDRGDLHSILNQLPHESAHSWMKGNFIVCVVLSVIGLLCPSFATVPAILLFLGPVWNFVDTGGGAVAGVADWIEAEERLRHKKIRKTLVATGFAGTLAMGGTGIWALVEIAKALKESSTMADLTGNGVLGITSATMALAVSSFAFAFAFFASAVAASFEAKWAWERSTPQGFIADREEKIGILNEKIDELHDKIYPKEGHSSDDPEKKKLMQELIIQKRRLINQKELMEKYEIKSENLTPAEKKIAEYLLKKQEIKARKKGMDAAAYYLGGCGAVFAGLALLLPPAAPVLFALSALFFTACAVIKGYQLYEKRKKKKARTEILKNETEDKLIAQYLGVPDQDLKKNFKYLSSEDREKIVDLQCKRKYEEMLKTKPKSGRGFFSRRRPSEVSRDMDEAKIMRPDPG